MNYKDLEEKVQQWFVDRNLHEANPVKQFLKLMEESGELFEGIAKDKSELMRIVYTKHTMLSKTEKGR